MTATHSIDYFVTTGTLLSAFVEKHREPDHNGNSSSFWALCTHDNDELTDFVRDLHDSEMPNDWRYQTIVDILNCIIEDSKQDQDRDFWEAYPMSCADYLTSIYTCELAAWYAANANRGFYHDEAEAEGLIKSDALLSERMAIGQARAIQQMIEKIMDRLGLTYD